MSIFVFGQIKRLFVFVLLPAAIVFLLLAAVYFSSQEDELKLETNHHGDDDAKIAMLILTATRPLAAQTTVEKFIRLRPSSAQFPIIISQDGDSAEVREVNERLAASHEGVTFIHHMEREIFDLATIGDVAIGSVYYTRHYKWALDKVFYEMGFELVVATEDDLDIAEDYFSYFNATRRLLYTDPSIWFISSHSENGPASDPTETRSLFRTDCVNSYGFMLRRQLWMEELSANWPWAPWDIHMRKESVRRERVCIQPVVSRSLHDMMLAGDNTVSSKLYKKYYEANFLPDQAVDFSTVDLSNLEKESYDAEFIHLLEAAEPIPLEQLLSSSWEDPLGGGMNSSSSYRVVYGDALDFARIAAKFNLMGDFFFGIPRTAYYGVVRFKTPSGSTIYAVHPNAHLGEEKSGRFGSELNSNVYDASWDATIDESQAIWNKWEETK